jgi:hypothetical protein
LRALAAPPIQAELDAVFARCRWLAQASADQRQLLDVPTLNACACGED